MSASSTSLRCTAPIEMEALIAYWLGELAPAEEGPLEAHLFGCAPCTRRLDELAALTGGIRAVVRAGAVAAVISVAFLETLKQQGLRIREYPVAPGGRVECTLRANDDAVVSRIQAALAGVERVDALQRLEVGGALVSEVRLADVPFDPAAGEVLFVPCAMALRKMPVSTMHVRLVAVEAAGERSLGEYTFAHTPSETA